MEQLVAWDKKAFLYLNSLGSETWDGFWLAMTDKWTAIPLYLLLLYLVFRKFGFKGTLLLLLAVALLITTTDQLSNFFKYGTTRLRPCHQEEIIAQMRLVKSYCGGKFSFFSAHAANSVGVAAFFSFLFRRSYTWLPILLLSWGLLVAYSRIYLGVHFPLDVITGAGVGVLFGWLYCRLFLKAQNRWA